MTMLTSIPSDEINVDILMYTDEGFVLVEYSYKGKSIQLHLPEEDIYTQSSQFNVEDFANILEPSYGQILWNGELINEEYFPF